MKTSNPKRNFVGLMTLPISGILALLALMIRGPVSSIPVDDFAEWSITTSSGIYQITQIMVVIAYVLPFFGFYSLYACLAGNDRVEQIAFCGMLTSLIGTALALPALGIATFVAPAVGRLFLQGQIDVSQVIIDSITGPGLIIGVASAILYSLGPICLGMAVWHCNNLPKWAGGYFALHGILLSFGFSFFPALILGWALFTISGGWITWSVYGANT